MATGGNGVTLQEDKRLAQMFVDLKSRRPKSEDWISIAKKCKEIADSYNSIRIAASTLGVSYNLLRSIISLLDLPVSVQEKIRQKRLGYDTAQRINTIKNAKRQIEVAGIIESLPQKQQREVIGYARRVPDGDVSRFVGRLTAPTKQKQVHVAIIPLAETEYLAVERARKKKGISMERLLGEIVKDWASSGRGK